MTNHDKLESKKHDFFVSFFFNPMSQPITNLVTIVPVSKSQASHKQTTRISQANHKQTTIVSNSNHLLTAWKITVIEILLTSREVC